MSANDLPIFNTAVGRSDPPIGRKTTEPIFVGAPPELEHVHALDPLLGGIHRCNPAQSGRHDLGSF